MYDQNFVISSTFESNWRDHEECPASQIHWNDEQAQCNVHDEWWELPSADEVLDL